MAGEQFKIGDTARPKSGGPLMTITGTKMEGDKQMVWTIWFDDEKNEKQGYYPAAALTADDGSITIA
jgi:uncharacterized protein YodC (DUF2158 family)